MRHRRRGRGRLPFRGILFLIVGLGLFAYRQWVETPSGGTPAPAPPASEAPTRSAPTSGEAAPRAVDGAAGTRTIAEAFRERRSDVVVEVVGTVDRLLRDDLEGSRHQKWILRLANDQTVLVSHNIDLAPRVPLERGDRIEVRGEYEWNARGGVLHWTHHDPRGRRPGGWIRHQGKTYK